MLCAIDEFLVDYIIFSHAVDMFFDPRLLSQIWCYTINEIKAKLLQNLVSRRAPIIVLWLEDREIRQKRKTLQYGQASTRYPWRRPLARVYDLGIDFWSLKQKKQNGCKDDYDCGAGETLTFR